MKRFWIGIGFLAALLALGIGTSAAVANVTEPITARLTLARDQALAGDTAQAEKTAALARQDWLSHWRMVACFADHTPMEQIDSQFAELQTYAAQNAWPDFAATCAGLESQVQSIPRAHQFTWWNLL